MRKQNGTLDMYKWRCIIPGRKNTSWEGGFYKLEIKFQVSANIETTATMTLFRHNLRKLTFS